MDYERLCCTGYWRTYITGIGRAAAFAFAKKGATVVIAARHGDAGKALVQELLGSAPVADFIQMDVRDEEDIRNAVDATVSRYGRLDVAVNNAGIEECGRCSRPTRKTK